MQIEVEKVKATIKKLWKASNRRREKETSNIVRAYEVGIVAGLQALCFEIGWEEIEKWK